MDTTSNIQHSGSYVGRNLVTPYHCRIIASLSRRTAVLACRIQRHRPSSVGSQRKKGKKLMAQRPCPGWIVRGVMKSAPMLMPAQNRVWPQLSCWLTFLSAIRHLPMTMIALFEPSLQSGMHPPCHANAIPPHWQDRDRDLPPKA